MRVTTRHPGLSRPSGTIAGRRAMAPGAATATTPALLYWRRQRALLQQELADRAGVHRTSVVRAEAGYPLRLNMVRKLAAALQVAPTDLMAQPPEA